MTFALLASPVAVFAPAGFWCQACWRSIRWMNWRGRATVSASPSAKPSCICPVGMMRSTPACLLRSMSRASRFSAPWRCGSAWRRMPIVLRRSACRRAAASVRSRDRGYGRGHAASGMTLLRYRGAGARSQGLRYTPAAAGGSRQAASPSAGTGAAVQPRPRGAYFFGVMLASSISSG